MSGRTRRRTPAIDRDRELLDDAVSQLRVLAQEVSALDLQDRERLAQELRGLGERLRMASEGQLRALGTELRIAPAPQGAPRDLRLTGEELERMARSLSTLSDGLHESSAELAWASLAKGREAMEAGRAYVLGVEVGESGFRLSTIAQRILALTDPQRRFLRILLSHPAAPPRKPPSGRGGLVSRKKTTSDEVWGALESEDLVRKRRRKELASGGKRTPKKILRFEPET